MLLTFLHSRLYFSFTSSMSGFPVHSGSLSVTMHCCLLGISSLSLLVIPMMYLQNSSVLIILYQKWEIHHKAVVGIPLPKEICLLSVLARIYFHFLAERELSCRAIDRELIRTPLRSFSFDSKTLHRHHATGNVNLVEEYSCHLSSCTDTLDH